MKRRSPRVYYEIVLSRGQLSLAILGLAVVALGCVGVGYLLGSRSSEEPAARTEELVEERPDWVGQSPARTPREPATTGLDRVPTDGTETQAERAPEVEDGPNEAPVEEPEILPETPRSHQTIAVQPEPPPPPAPAEPVEPIDFSEPELPSDAVGPEGGPGSWLVQVLATPAEAEARRLADKLTGDGFPAFVAMTRSGNQTMFRVRVGTYRARVEAEEAARDLKGRYGFDPWVVR